MAFSALAGSANAQDATWLAVPTVAGFIPGTFSFNDGTNWNTAAVPTGTAFFGPTAGPDLGIDINTFIGSFTFNADAANYSFTTFGFLEFTGAGIVINGGGSVTLNANGGAVIFQNNSTASSATINNDFLVIFSDNSRAGSAIVNNNAGAGLVFEANSTAENATIVNNGETLFFNNSTAGNAVITNNAGGVLQFTNDSTGGNATITNNAGGTLDFFDNSTAGNAAITNNAGGVVDISNLASAGLTAGSIAGAGDFLLGSKSLTTGSNNLSTEVSGIIAGAGGSLTKVGAGALTLSGANTYTGATAVNGGSLIVNGSIAASSDLTVNAGGLVGGTGFLPGTTINGGTLSPGNSIGTITVQGNLMMTAGSTYRVELDGAASDRTNVTGTATLAGTVQAVPIGGLQQSYTILSAAGGLGGSQFGGVTTLPGFNTSLGYAGNDVRLSFTAVLGQNQNLPQNQQNVANTLNAFFNNGGALPAGFLAPFALTGPALVNALAQLSGEGAAGIQQSANLSMGMFLNAMVDPFVMGRNGGGFGAAAQGAAEDAMAKAVTKAPLAPPTFEQRWSVWGSAYGGRSRTDGDATVVGSNDTTATAAGFAAGADYRVSPNAVVGAAVAIGETRWSSLGSGDSNVAQVGGYASARWNGFYLSGAVAFAWHNVDTERTVAVAGFDRLEADFNATSFGARLEGGHRFALGYTAAASYGVTPYAAVQVQSLRTPAYSEAATFGSNQFALSYASQTATDTRTELGAWLDSRHALADGSQLVLRGRAAWVHDFNPESRFNAAFQTLPGASFTVDGVAAAENSALLSAVGELRLRNGISLIAKADGEFSARSHTYAGTGTVRYRW